MPITDPLLLRQWHPLRNGDLSPRQVSPGSHRKVWWRCDRGHEWQAEIKSRALLGTGCPVCAGKGGPHRGQRPGHSVPPARRPVGQGAKREPLPRRGPPRQPQKGLVALRQGPPLAGLRGLPDRRGRLPRLRREGGGPRGERPGHPVSGDRRPVAPPPATALSRRRRRPPTATAACGGSVRRATPTGRRWPPGPTGGTGCPYCAGRRVLPGFNDLATLFPQVAAQWHPTLNGPLTPRPGDGGVPEDGVVAVPRGPRVEGPGPHPDGAAAVRLSGVRRAGEGGKP